MVEDAMGRQALALLKQLEAAGQAADDRFALFVPAPHDQRLR